MQRKARLPANRRSKRSPRTSLSRAVRDPTIRRGLTPEEWVDQTYERGMQKIRRALEEKLLTLPPGSRLRAYVEELQGLPNERLYDEIHSRVHANPERAGCPPYRVLVELATRTRGIDDPEWEHIASCHPCLSEVCTMSRAYRPRPS